MTLSQRPILLSNSYGGPSSTDATIPSPAAPVSPSPQPHAQTWDLKAVGFFNQVLRQATDPTLAIPAILAGPLGPLGEVTLARGLLAKGTASLLGRGLSLKYLPLLAGFGAETVAFGLGSRSLTHLLRGPVAWDPASVVTDLALTGMTLGVLKAGNAVGRKVIFAGLGLNGLKPQQWTQADHRALLFGSQVSAYLGLVTAQGMEKKFYPQFYHGSGNIWADSLSTHLALGFGTIAGRFALGKPFQNFEGQIHDRLQQVYQQTKPQWGLFGSQQKAVAEGIASELNWNAMSKEGSAGKGSTGKFPAVKDDSGFLSKSNFPETFKNGELFTVSMNCARELDGAPILKIPEEFIRTAEEKDHLSSEDTIAKFIQNHATRLERARSRPEPFLVYYGEKKPVNGNIVRDKIQKIFGSNFPEFFVVGLAAPLTASPMFYVYRKRASNLETLNASLIRPNLKSSILAEPTRTPIPKSIIPPAPSIPPSIRSTAERSSTREPTRKEPSLNDYSFRNRTVSTVSELAETFQQVLELMDTQKDTFNKDPWRIEVSNSFISLKPNEIAELSTANRFDLEKHPEREAMQERVFGQIQSELITKLSEVLRRHSIPPGQVFNIKWGEPFTTTLTLQEKDGKICISVFSLTGLPKRDVSFDRKDLRREIPDLTKRNPLWQLANYSQIMETPPTPTHPTEPALESAFQPRTTESKLEPTKISIERPSLILGQLALLFHTQNRNSLSARPIQITLQTGHLESPFLDQLLEFLHTQNQTYPLREDQLISITWNVPHAEVRAWREKDKIHAQFRQKSDDGISFSSAYIDESGTKGRGGGFTKGLK